ncbi:helix-turn-helix domain-containing protein [Clostridium sp.]|uniref:helix-turn-helix domain-containing protein n=2 Tax=Clostridium sp. TaxID=1506 RepID=UPI002FDCED5C
MVLSRKEIGLLIRKARQYKSKAIQKKYTQQMLAEDLHLSRGYIGKIENGKIYPEAALLAKIAEICGVPPDFFDGTNKIYNSKLIQPTDCSENSKTNKDSGSLIKNPSSYPDITDVKQAIELILSQPGLTLNREILSDESKTAIANALNMGLAYVEKLQEKQNTKYK